MLRLPVLVLAVLMTAARLLGADDAPVPGPMFLRANPGPDTVRFVIINQRDQLLPVNVGNWWGYANHRGELVIWTDFDWADEFHDGLGRVVVLGRTGFLNTFGRWAIAPTFAWADSFSEGSAVVGTDRPAPHTGRRYGFINQRGQVVIEPRYDDALRFADGLAAVQVGALCGFVNRRGDEVIARQFAMVRSFSQGLAMVRIPSARGDDHADPQGELGFIDKRGQVVFRVSADRVADLGPFSDGLARIRTGRLWGYLDRRFGLAIEPRFDEARDFVDGLAAVRVGEKWGYIDKRGRMAIEPAYDWAWDVHENLALVRVGDLHGFIDRAGKWQIEPTLPQAQPYRHSRVRVWGGDLFAYLDTAGRPIWGPRTPLYAQAGDRPVRLLDGERLQGWIGREVVAFPPPRPATAVPYLPPWTYRDRDYLPRETPGP